MANSGIEAKKSMHKPQQNIQETVSGSVSFPDLPNTSTAPSTYELTQSTPEKYTFPEIWREALLPYLGTRLVLLIVGLLTTFYILPVMVNHPVLPDHATYVRFPQALWLMWYHFDSGFYTDIARHGYWSAETLHSASNWAFFPLYPWLIAWIHGLFGSSEDAYVITGVVISLIASVAAIGYLYALVFREFGKRVAALTVLYLSLFPTSFYFSAVYPEALFLLFVIASIYYARRQSWLLACLLGGLAALTRPQGIFMIVPIGWEYLRVTAQWNDPLPRLRISSLGMGLKSIYIWFLARVQGLWKATHSIKNWLKALLLLLIPAGLFVFMIYGKIKTGDLLATFHNEQWGWHRGYTFFARLLIFSLRNPIMNQPFDWNFWLVNIILAFIFLGLILLAFSRLPSIYAFYTLVMVMLPLSSNFLNSFDRYCIIVFPAFLLLALYTQEKRPRLRQFLLGGFAALQAIFMLFFVVGLPPIA
jgi:hypothetical protein